MAPPKYLVRMVHAMTLSEVEWRIGNGRMCFEARVSNGVQRGLLKINITKIPKGKFYKMVKIEDDSVREKNSFTSPRPSAF